MFCPECGGEISEGDDFCSVCGTKVSAPAVSENKEVAAKAETKTVPVKQKECEDRPYIPNYNPRMDYRPIGMWGYFGYGILFSIPVVGFIVALVLSFGGTRNINLRNYARSMFCTVIICAVLALIVLLFSASFGYGVSRIFDF